MTVESNEKKMLSDLTVLSKEEAYTRYEKYFQRDGMRIYGELYFPNHQKKSPLVIIGHGFGETYQSTADVAAVFAGNGIAAYVFDFCGGSSYTSSDGETTDMSVLTERDDMETVLDGMKNSEFVESDSIFLMGQSQGGFVAALLAEKRAEDVKGLVLFYPAFVIPDDARKLFEDVSQIPSVNTLFGTKVGYRYYADVLHMNTYTEIGSYDEDVLIVHGDQDRTVPISYAEQAVDTYPSAELLTMEGAGHGFYGEMFDRACEAAVQYVQSRV